MILAVPGKTAPIRKPGPTISGPVTYGPNPGPTHSGPTHSGPTHPGPTNLGPTRRRRRRAPLAVLLLLALGLSTLAGSTAARADGSGTYKLPIYTYGETANTYYLHWVINIFGGGATPYTMVYSNTSIGYQTSAAPTAGTPLYVHMATANISVNEPGMFALALNPEASGLRLVTDGSLGAVCRKGPIGAAVDFPCRAPVAGAEGTTWADPVPLAPGEQLDVQVPVVIDGAGGQVISAVCQESQFLNRSYKAQVSVPVGAAAPAPAPTQPAPTQPAPTQPAPTQPAPTTQAPSQAPVPSVFVKAVSRAGKLYVDIDPNRGKGYWRFRVDKQLPDGTWKPGKTYRTKGSKETRTINLKKGSYQVYVPAAFGFAATTSAPVTLVR